MRRPPEIYELHRFPVTGGTIILAVGVTLAFWTKVVDITPLLEDANIRRGQLWRLVTSALPHVNLLHLAFNAYWIWTFGTLVEQVFGHLRACLLFLLLAAASAAAEFAIMDGGIGLSGVGYGLFALLWVLSSRDPRFRDSIDAKTVSLFVVWFFLCIAMTIGGVMPVANIAHGVGAVTGALLGFCIATSQTRAAPVVPRIGLATSIALYLAAATVFRPWINLSPTGYTAEAQLGYELLTANQNQAALRWYTDAVRMRPSDSSLWYSLGIAHDRLGHELEATHAYRRALDLAPGNTEYRATFAARLNHQAYEKQTHGDVAGAIRLYQEALTVSPSDAWAWYNLGVAYQHSDLVISARDAYKRAHELAPDKPNYRQAWLNLDPFAIPATQPDTR